jgi:hypothetical protein
LATAAAQGQRNNGINPMAVTGVQMQVFQGFFPQEQPEQPRGSVDGQVQQKD